MFRRLQHVIGVIGIIGENIVRIIIRRANFAERMAILAIGFGGDRQHYVQAGNIFTCRQGGADAHQRISIGLSGIVNRQHRYAIGCKPLFGVIEMPERFQNTGHGLSEGQAFIGWRVEAEKVKHIAVLRARVDVPEVGFLC